MIESEKDIKILYFGPLPTGTGIRTYQQKYHIGFPKNVSKWGKLTPALERRACFQYALRFYPCAIQYAYINGIFYPCVRQYVIIA